MVWFSLLDTDCRHSSMVIVRAIFHFPPLVFTSPAQPRVQVNINKLLWFFFGHMKERSYLQGQLFTLIMEPLVLIFIAVIQAKASSIWLMFSFVSSLSRLSSAAVSKDANLICGGFEDSSILLSSLTPKKLVHPRSKPKISKIQLSPGMQFKWIGGISEILKFESDTHSLIWRSLIPFEWPHFLIASRDSKV